MKHNLYVILIILLISGCENDGTNDYNYIDVSISEANSIGLGSSKNDLLGAPVMVRVSNDGDVYVADRDLLTIRIFDKNGKWIRDIGQRGEGPGDFQSISSMDIDEYGKLYVTDILNRRFDNFKSTGEYVDSVPLRVGKEDYVLPGTISLINDNRFIAIGNRLGDKEVAGLHIVKMREHLEVMETVLAVDTLTYANEVTQRFERSGSGSLLVSENHDIVYAPKYYQGTLWHLAHDESTNSWITKRRMTGVVNSDLALEEISPDDFDPHHPQHLMMRIISTQEGRIAARINNMSVGLHEDSDGFLYHFTHIRSANGIDYDFGVEVFSPDGELRGYSTLPQIGRSEPVIYPYLVQSTDKQGRFYLNDRYATPPAIHIVKLSFETAKP